MYGVTINGVHCTEYNLVLTAVNNPFPTVKAATVEIPGADGALDLTEIFGQPKFNNRTLTLTFSDLRGYHTRYDDQTMAAWAMHGKKVPIVLDEDPDYFYLGRISFNEWTQTAASGDLVVTCDCDPFKYEFAMSDEEWLWDPFNFETGVIRGYGDIMIHGTKTVVVAGCRKTIVPTIVCTEPMQVVFNGKTYSLSAGQNIVYDIALQDGENELIFNGNGIISVVFRGARL